MKIKKLPDVSSEIREMIKKTGGETNLRDSLLLWDKLNEVIDFLNQKK